MFYGDYAVKQRHIGESWWLHLRVFIKQRSVFMTQTIGCDVNKSEFHNKFIFNLSDFSSQQTLYLDACCCSAWMIASSSVDLVDKIKFTDDRGPCLINIDRSVYILSVNKDEGISKTLYITYKNTWHIY